MPTPGTEAELRQAGYTPKGTEACRKCQVLVDVWESPTGKKVPWNSMQHPTAPGIMHDFSCGEDLTWLEEDK